MKICGIYKITNTITGDFYIGSSKNVKRRLAAHKCKSTWNRYSNNPLYKDMEKYGLDKFEFQVIAEVEIDKLKEIEQQFIEELNPIYNNYNAKGWNIERFKKTKKEYHKFHKDELKEYQKEYQKKYQKSEKCKEIHKKYQKSEKCKEIHRKYQNQLCIYNGEILTLNALVLRFYRAGIPHPTLEAKKYLLKK